MTDIYTPVNGNLLDAITTAALRFVGWGGIEFVYFIVLLFIAFFLLKVYFDLR